MNELLAMVKFNDRKGFVLKNKLNFHYEKHGNVIIGIDDSGIFLDCLYYENPVPGFEAFGGRSFDIILTDGSVIHCNGQYWGGLTEYTKKIINEPIVRVTVDDIESLRNCYVFSGYYAIERKLKELENSYSGDLFEYKEYRSLLNIGIY